MEERCDLLIQPATVDRLTGASAMEGATDWWSSKWLGDYFRSGSGWMLHVELGWLYPSPSAGDGLWLWKESLGWVWTEEEIYPYLYSSSRDNWLYFFGAVEQNRLLYDYGIKNWIKLEESSVIEREESR